MVSPHSTDVNIRAKTVFIFVRYTILGVIDGPVRSIHSDILAYNNREINFLSFSGNLICVVIQNLNTIRNHCKIICTIVFPSAFTYLNGLTQYFLFSI